MVAGFRNVKNTRVTMVQGRRSDRRVVKLRDWSSETVYFVCFFFLFSFFCGFISHLIRCYTMDTLKSNQGVHGFLFRFLRNETVLF